MQAAGRARGVLLAALLAGVGACGGNEATPAVGGVASPGPGSAAPAADADSPPAGSADTAAGTTPPALESVPSAKGAAPPAGSAAPSDSAAGTTPPAPESAPSAGAASPPAGSADSVSPGPGSAAPSAGAAGSPPSAGSPAGARPNGVVPAPELPVPRPPAVPGELSSPEHRRYQQLRVETLRLMIEAARRALPIGPFQQRIDAAARTALQDVSEAADRMEETAADIRAALAASDPAGR